MHPHGGAVGAVHCTAALWMWLCPIECEGLALDGVSPALRAGASDFGKTHFLLKVRPKVFSPGKPSASRIPLPPSSGRTDRRTRHFGLRHPWLRPKPASSIPVLAPYRGRAVLTLIRSGPSAACGCAVVHDDAPDPLNSARRLSGGNNTLPVSGTVRRAAGAGYGRADP
jgi:hypothetical protein